MQKHEKILIGLLGAFAIAFVIILVFLFTNQKSAEKSYITEVRVKSGEVEVRGEDRSERLKAGEELIIEGNKPPVKTVKKIRTAEAAAEPADTSTFSISGRIEDDAGNLVADVKIKLYESDDSIDSPSLMTKSDDQGLFKFENVTEGKTFTLRAEYEGYWSEEIENVEAGDSEVMVIFKTGPTLTGRVVDYYNDPVPSATVMLIKQLQIFAAPDPKWDFKKDKTVTQTTVTDDDGHFVFLNLFPHKYELHASAKGYFPSAVKYVQVRSDRPLEAVMLVLRNKSTLSGIVLDEQSNPVAGAEFLIFHDQLESKYGHEAYNEANPSYSFQNQILSVRNGRGKRTNVYFSDDKTDSQGYFHLTLSGKGNYKIYARHKDYGPCQPYETFIEGGEHYKNITFVLSSARPSVTGTVIDKEGEAIENVDVQLIFGGSDGFVSDKKITDTEGSFYLEPPFYATFQIAAKKTGYVKHRTAKFAIDENKPNHNIDIVLDKAYSISGKIMLRPDVPVSFEDNEIYKLKVSLRDKKGNLITWGPFFRDRKLIPRKNGEFDIDNVEAGVYDILVNCVHDGNSYESIATNVPAGTTDLEIILIKDAATIKGQIVDALTKLPIRSSQITLISRTHDPRFEGSGWVYIEKNISSVDGDFAIEDVPIGTYDIYIKSENYGPAQLKTIKLEKEEVRDLGMVELSKGYDIHGKIISAIDGKPIHGAEVGVPGTITVSAEDGSFTLSKVLEGKTDLIVTHAEYAKKLEVITVDQAFASVERLIELHKGGTISGTVRRPDGSPIPNFEVRHWYPTRMDTLRTNEEGFYYISNAHVGANDIGCGYQKKRIYVKDGQDVVTDFVIPEGHTLSGKILERHFGPKQIGVLILIETAGHDSEKNKDIINVITDSSGRFSIPGIPPGKYIVEFYSYGKEGKGKNYFHIEHVEIDKDTELNIETENSLFSGRIISSTGNVLKRMHLESPDSEEGVPVPYVEIDQNGTFSFGRIPPGKYNLFVDNIFIKEIEIPKGKDLTDVTITVD